MKPARSFAFRVSGKDARVVYERLPALWVNEVSVGTPDGDFQRIGRAIIMICFCQKTPISAGWPPAMRPF